MKILLRHEFKIQSITVGLFLFTFLLIKFIDDDVIAKIIISEFFLIAVVQYTFNIIKFFSKEYVKTDSRRVYIFLASYVVIGFLLLIIFSIFNISKGSLSLKNLFELMVMSWVVISPILIIQSLFISHFDTENKL